LIVAKTAGRDGYARGWFCIRGSLVQKVSVLKLEKVCVISARGHFIRRRSGH